MKIRIQNFQAHKDLILDLDAPITTIVGPSDSGKSAIVRALRWFVLNKPSGTSFIKEGTKGCKISIKTNNKILSKVRTNYKNQYILKVNNDEQVFEAFGNDIPDPINQEINMGPLNFQFQHDAPFWFSETAGEVSRQLNQIVNLSIIDSTLKSISSSVRKSKSIFELRTQEEEQAKEKYNEYMWVQDCALDFDSVQNYNKECNETKEKTQRLQILVECLQKEYSTIQESYAIQQETNYMFHILPEWENTCKFIKTLSSISSKLKEAQRITKQEVPSIQTMLSIAKELKDVQISAKVLQEHVTQTKTHITRTSAEVPSISKIIKYQKPYTDIIKKTDLLFTLIQKVKKSIQLKNKFEQEYKKSKQKIQKQIGNTCPLCGSNIKD